MKIPLAQIAELLGAELQGDPQKVIRGVAPFESAGPYDITVAASAKFVKRIAQTNAGAVIVPRKVGELEQNLLPVEHPMVAFVHVAQQFHPPPEPVARIHSQAAVGQDVKFGESVDIGPCAVVGDRVRIGNRVVIGPGAVLGDDTVIGDEVHLHPNVTILARCRVGSRVVVHSGTVIGSDGFGFAPDGKRYHKQPHTGIVIIGDDVEIGANNTIDRATFGETRIGNGVKTDNLVHIAHNVRIGDNSVIVSQVGISGSVTVGDNVTLAGQAGVAGHLNIGDNAIVGPRAGIAKDVPPGQVMMGAPEMPHKLWLRVQRIIPLLPELKKRLDDLEKRLAQLTPDKGE